MTDKTKNQPSPDFKCNWFSKLFPYFLTILLAVSFGFFWISWHIDYFKNHNLPSCLLEVKPSLLQGSIVGVPIISQNDENTNSRFPNRVTSFDFLVNNVNKVRLKWLNAPINIYPGDYWQLYVILKKPRNFSTPGSFDLEKYMFTERLYAVGKVIGSSNNILQKPYVNSYASYFNLPVQIDRIRQNIINKLNLAANKHKLHKNSIILALGLGVKGNINARDLVIFQNTGTAHLLAISGLHLSFIAGLGFLITNFLWKRCILVRLLEKIPACIIASWVSVIVTELSSNFVYSIIRQPYHYC